MTYNTDRRGEIISLLSSESDKAFTTEEICKRIITEGGKSTVYRIVSELVEDAVVKRISDGKTRHCSYQYVGSSECKSHLHLKCRDCGKLIHLDKGVSESFASALRESGGFMREDGCILFGKCTRCDDSESTNHCHDGGCL